MGNTFEKLQKKKYKFIVVGNLFKKRIRLVLGRKVFKTGFPMSACLENFSDDLSFSPASSPHGCLVEYSLSHG